MKPRIRGRFLTWINSMADDGELLMYVKEPDSHGVSVRQSLLGDRMLDHYDTTGGWL